MGHRRQRKRKPSGGSTAPGIHSDSVDAPIATRRWLPIIVIAVVIVVYLNSFSGVFVFDDTRAIIDDGRIRDLGLFWKDLIRDRRPTVWLSLAVNYAIGELEVWGYHLVNLVVHILAALTLYGVVRRTLLLRAAGFSPRGASDVRDAAQAEACGSQTSWLAVVIAVIWAVHPLQTQSVTYIIQRGESMMGLFYLLTIYSLIRGANSSRPRVWYAAAIVACALGMGSKAVMISAPVVVLLYDWVFIAGSLAGVLRRRRGLYVGLGATWIVLIATGVAQGVLNPSPGQQATVGFGYKGFTPLEYALTQPGAILHYLKLSCWPHPLCLDYWWPAAKTAGAIVLPGMVIVGLLIATLWSFAKRPWVGFLGTWFFLILAPTSSLIPIKDAAFEHRMYLPLAAVVVLLVSGAYRLLERIYACLSLRPASARWVNATLVLAVVASCAYGTIQRNKDYHSAYAMWGDVVGKRPLNPRAHTDFGKTLKEQGRIEEAIAHYDEALRLKPNYFMGHNNLGNARIAQGRIDEGIVHLREAIRLKPRFAIAHNGLGGALAQQGEFAEAASHFAQAVRLNPIYAPAHSNLANTLAVQGKIDEAIPHYLEALRLKRDFPDAHNNLASALLEQGRIDEAIEHLVEAIRLKPDYTNAINNLAIALVRQGHIEETIKRYGDRAPLDRAHVEAYVLSGDEFRRRGQIDEAVNAYRKALSINPSHQQARTRLEAITTDPQTYPSEDG